MNTWPKDSKCQIDALAPNHWTLDSCTDVYKWRCLWQTIPTTLHQFIKYQSSRRVLGMVIKKMKHSAAHMPCWGILDLQSFAWVICQVHMSKIIQLNPDCWWLFNLFTALCAFTRIYRYSQVVFHSYVWKHWVLINIEII